MLDFGGWFWCLDFRFLDCLFGPCDCDFVCLWFFGGLCVLILWFWAIWLLFGCGFVLVVGYEWGYLPNGLLFGLALVWLLWVLCFWFAVGFTGLLNAVVDLGCCFLGLVYWCCFDCLCSCFHFVYFVIRFVALWCLICVWWLWLLVFALMFVLRCFVWLLVWFDGLIWCFDVGVWWV